MTALFRFLDVRCEGSDRAYSFIMHSGETLLLQLSSEAEKDAMIDLVIGETDSGKGDIEIAQGDRGRDNIAGIFPLGDGKHDNEATPTIWQSLSASRPGRVGWVAANGGLISNLKIWENVTLPLWYHVKQEVIETEQSVMHWLSALGMEQDAFAEFMAASPYSSELWQRKLAGLLRALVQMPQVLVVDAVVFEDVKEHFAQRWITALGAYAAQGHTILVIADKPTTLPWEKIE
jgi:ABC-type multidrug transport system ATPase subunit